MELNGVANMLAIIDMAGDTEGIHPSVAKMLRDQLDILERYMVALRKAQLNGEPPPEWSTVRDNRNVYPNNRGEVQNDVHNES